MKPFVLLVAIFFSCGMAQQGTFLNSNEPGFTYTELKNLPHNQHGFTLTNNQYNTPTRTSSEFTEEQKKVIKAQHDFRKSVALANENHLKVQKEEQVNGQNIGLDLPTRHSEPFRPSQPFDESSIFRHVPPSPSPSPPAYVPLNTNFAQGSEVRQIGDAQSFNSQRVETFTQTETPQIFQRIRPLPTFRNAPKQEFVQEQPQFAQEQPRFAQEQPRFAQEQPRFAQEQPRFAQEQPRFAQEQPRFAQEQPRFVQEKPQFVQEHPQIVQEPQEFVRKPQENFRQGVQNFQVVHNQNQKPEETFPSFIQNQPLVDKFKTAVEPQKPKPRQRLLVSLPESLEETKAPTTEEALFKEQAQNAKYSFQSSVSDTINDNSHIRQETRDGLKLTGLYSYSDGFFKRTVHYVADENGYRIVKEESSPIGTGPVHNPSGQVDVKTDVSGSSLQYTLKGDRLPKHRTSSHVDREARNN